MIYDCFMFFNELDVLEIRLNELYDTVDKFILVEATKTFTNKDKPLWFSENKERFNPFLDKIEHIIINEYPEFDSAWTFENYQRDVIIKTLKGCCQPEDVILISDLDEIPKADLIKKYKDSEGVKIFEQKLFTFYFNYLNTSMPVWKEGTRLLKFKDIADKTLTDIRLSGGEYIKDAGWHFTYLGGLDMVKYKIKSFAHQEYNSDYYMNDERLKRLIQDGIDIFERGYKYKIVNIDKTFPEYVYKNKKKFEKFIIKKQHFVHKLNNAFLKSKGYDRRYIDIINPINSNPILDFISPNTEKIIQLGDNIELKTSLKNKFKISDYKIVNINKGLYLDIDSLTDKFYDCIVMDKTFTQLYAPEEFLLKIKSKLNRNGYIVMIVPNFRYIKNLDKILFKKFFDFDNEQLRFYTRKTLFDIINKAGYYFISFKGLNPDESLSYKLKNALYFGNLYDAKPKYFLSVIKPYER